VAKEEPSARHRRKLRVSLSTAILIGLTLGIVFGLVVGEYAAPLRIVGNAFIALLQMTVLPYIMVALVVSIGALSPQRAWQLAKKAGFLLLAFWALGIAIVLIIPLAFPDLTTASFFSTSLLEPPRQIDYLRLYIPSNPFNSMANSVIPAVVLFSIAIGIAVIGIKKKSVLIEPLSVLSDALTRVNAFVVKLTPAGVFALAAGAAGNPDAGAGRPPPGVHDRVRGRGGRGGAVGPADDPRRVHAVQGRGCDQGGPGRAGHRLRHRQRVRGPADAEPPGQDAL
jgi:Na+/H+-dicarboxylate symporter